MTPGARGDLTDTLLCVLSSPVISPITNTRGHRPHLAPTRQLQYYDLITLQSVTAPMVAHSCAGPTLVLSHLCYADFIIHFVCHSQTLSDSVRLSQTQSDSVTTVLNVFKLLKGVTLTMILSCLYLPNNKIIRGKH